MVNVRTPEYDNVEIGYDIDSFIERVSQHNSNVYFHNLRFDGTFILDWLLRNGYEFTVSKFKTAPGMFKALISSQNKFYSITVCWKNGKTTEFRDSYKKFPNMSVSRIADTFKLEESKGKIDYEKYRPPGYILDENEEDYLRKDVCIVAQALLLQLDEGMTKLTTASDSMHEFKRLFGEKAFKRYFPALPNQMDKEIRYSYRGGWTYADKRHVGKRVGNGLVLDVNSLYPATMRFALLPYGEPTYHSGYVELTDKRPLSIFSVTFTARIKRNHVPCIQIKGQSFFSNTEYLEVIKEPTTLWVTSVDWELWNEHYQIEVYAYNGGWSFKAAHGFFDEYVDKWSTIKASAVGGRREIAKMYLNSLYGKFASNPNVTGKVPSLEDNRLKLTIGEDETRPPVYTAMGSFITAHARALTIRAAQVNYATFAYADTDSLHLLTDELPSELEVHPDNLGAWKLEYTFGEAVYVRSKFYSEKDCVTPKGHEIPYITKAAGLPDHMSKLLTFDDLVPGTVIDGGWVRERSGDPSATGKLQPKIVPGGVVLEERPWTV
ncbi:DNA polymerase [Curtobacterium phage Pize]|uniref:DNA polymerase n=1 Tax=Curtobacterium phage Pize TaxID=2851068 RepID=UPI00220250E1|nr:DNA polymerase [Curtobacterium phage Pize]QXG07735.1 DNA polymerase [Curtobacterium phage Pize]